jgi:hypothetical protein
MLRWRTGAICSAAWSPVAISLDQAGVIFHSMLSHLMNDKMDTLVMIVIITQRRNWVFDWQAIVSSWRNFAQELNRAPVTKDSLFTTLTFIELRVPVWRETYYCRKDLYWCSILVILGKSWMIYWVLGFVPRIQTVSRKLYRGAAARPAWNQTWRLQSTFKAGVLEWIKGIFQSRVLLVIYILSEVVLKW